MSSEADDTTPDLDLDEVTPLDEQGDVPLADLVVHEVRPDWGAAILLDEQDDRRTYQFEDGRRGKFIEGFYHHFKPVVDRAPDEVARTVEALERMAGAQRVTTDGDAVATPTGPSFEDRVQVLRHRFPHGFADDDWKERKRGGSGRRALRHRVPLLEDAKELLDPATLRKRVEDGEAAEVLTDLKALADSSDMLTKTRRTQIAAIEPVRCEELILRLADVCEDAEANTWDASYAAWLSELESHDPKLACWSVSTFFPALRAPHHHMFVRGQTMKKLAASLAPQIPHDTSPTARLYDTYRTLAASLRDRLKDEGLEAADMVDVYDFVRYTQRKKNLQKAGLA